MDAAEDLHLVLDPHDLENFGPDYTDNLLEKFYVRMHVTQNDNCSLRVTSLALGVFTLRKEGIAEGISVRGGCREG